MLQSTRPATNFVPDTVPVASQPRNIVCDEKTIMNTLNASGLPTDGN